MGDDYSYFEWPEESLDIDGEIYPQGKQMKIKDSYLNGEEDDVEEFVPINAYDPANYVQQTSTGYFNDHTVFTAEAWRDLMEQASEMLKNAKFDIQPWQMALFDCPVSTPRYSRGSIVTPRRSSRGAFRGIVDEWATYAYSQKVDVTRLKDPEYLDELKEQISERVGPKSDEYVPIWHRHRRGDGYYSRWDLPDSLQSSFPHYDDNIYFTRRISRSAIGDI